MEFSVFEFRDYKAYLKAWIQRRPSKGRGEKSRMATHLRCHNTYLTQVLEGDALREGMIAKVMKQAKKFTWEQAAAKLLSLYETISNIR